MKGAFNGLVANSNSISKIVLPRNNKIISRVAAIWEQIL